MKCIWKKREEQEEGDEQVIISELRDEIEVKEKGIDELLQDKIDLELELNHMGEHMAELIEQSVNLGIVKTDMVRDKVEEQKIQKAVARLEKMELIVTDFGRVFHAVGRKYTMPPSSCSAKKYKPCKKCFARAVRAC